uniref:Uncharacterized protein n=1 Tax=Colobus angolensis palliatus TaxID=336983 RepID=A0A2K5IAZ7_COLAP
MGLHHSVQPESLLLSTASFSFLLIIPFNSNEMTWPGHENTEMGPHLVLSGVLGGPWWWFWNFQEFLISCFHQDSHNLLLLGFVPEHIIRKSAIVTAYLPPAPLHKHPPSPHCAKQ